MQSTPLPDNIHHLDLNVGLQYKSMHLKDTLFCFREYTLGEFIETMEVAGEANEETNYDAEQRL